MKLTLIDLDLDVVNAWKEVFINHPEINIIHGDIFDYAYNTVVSPANSYGFMDGGIDKIYRKYFDAQLEKNIRNKISKLKEGYLPVGESLLVETKHEHIPYMIVAPTVFLPEAIPSKNCAFAFRSILIMSKKYPNKIKHIYCPGLGTGVGKVDPIESANEMLLAYEKMCLNNS